MKKFYAGLFVSICVGLAAGCAGTGTKDVSVYTAAIENTDSAAFVIARRTGYTGSAALIGVKIDGAEVGALGEQEVGVYEVSEGAHTIDVAFKGIAGIGVNSVSKTRQLTAGEKVYFSIQQMVGLLSSELKMLELTKSGFYEE